MDPRHRRVIWTDPAQEHLDQAVAYLTPHSFDAARRMLEAALATAASLETLSERGRLAPELNAAGIRELMVGRYRLIYSVTEHEVTILAFLHAPGTCSASESEAVWISERRCVAANCSRPHPLTQRQNFLQ